MSHLEVPALFECGRCHKCIDAETARTFTESTSMLRWFGVVSFVVCPRCGNKRCPRASDHRLACTNSNAPGQPGSVY